MSVILSEVKGFTPVIDVLAQELGFVTAGVYGLIWRHCQLNDGVCRASVKTLADMLDVSTRTIRRHIEKLIDSGYVEDTTPNLTNKPHIYKDTGKVKIEALIEVKKTMHKPQDDCDTESQQNGSTVTLSHTAMTESHSRYDLKSTEDTNKETIKDTRISKDIAISDKMSHQESSPGREWFLALADICVVNLSVATQTQKNQLGQSSKILKKAGATPEQIRGFAGWWYAEDWRGKQGQPPTPAQVRSEWGKFVKAGGTGGNKVISLGR